MVRIVQRKLVELGKGLIINLPSEFIHTFRLLKGGAVNVIIASKGLVLLDQNIDFDAEALKRELDEAQELWDNKEVQEDLDWFKRLSPEERAEVKKFFQEFVQADKDLDEGKGELQ